MRTSVLTMDGQRVLRRIDGSPCHEHNGPGDDRSRYYLSEILRTHSLARIQVPEDGCHGCVLDRLLEAMAHVATRHESCVN